MSNTITTETAEPISIELVESNFFTRYPGDRREPRPRNARVPETYIDQARRQIPIVVHGAGITTPWNAWGVDSPCP
jgi:hypothetical protein